MAEAVGVCLVSADAGLLEDVVFVLDQIRVSCEGCASERAAAGLQDPSCEAASGSRAVLRSVMRSVSTYLKCCNETLLPALRLLHYGSYAEAIGGLGAMGERASVEIFLVDAVVLATTQEREPDSESMLARLIASCRRASAPPRLSPSSVLMYVRRWERHALHGNAQGNLQLRLRVADSAVQIFGGMGYCKELPIERYYRDARVLRLYDGTSEVHRVAIARSLPGNRGVVL